MSIILSSLPIFIYAILGDLLWHVVVRPIEEKDMDTRFGSAYKVYKQKVRCWVPRL